MAYENGEKVNRHAAQEKHRKELKRRHTPENFSSYEGYAKEQETFYEQNDIKPRGDKFYFQKWWKGYSGYVSSSWKKFLKNAAHRKERNYYRDEINRVKASNEEDEDVNKQDKKFDDPWNWD